MKTEEIERLYNEAMSESLHTPMGSEDYNKWLDIASVCSYAIRQQKRENRIARMLTVVSLECAKQRAMSCLRYFQRRRNPNPEARAVQVLVYNSAYDAGFRAGFKFASRMRSKDLTQWK